MPGNPAPNSSQKPKRRRLVIIVALLLIGGSLGLFLFTALEPTIDGAPASYWVEQLGGAKPEADRAIANLDALGIENAGPYLIRGMEVGIGHEGLTSSFYRRIYGWSPSFLRQRLRVPGSPVSGGTLQYRRTRISYYLANTVNKSPAKAAVVVPELGRLISHTNAEIRFASALALANLGTNAVTAMPAIEKLLRTEPDKLNDPLLRTLPNCVPTSTSLAPVLKGLLSKTNNPYRFGIARTLWELDPSEANTVRAIVQPYKISRKAGDRIDAASLLWRMDRDPDEVLPTLISLLKDDDTVFDHRTIQLLKQIGPGARDAIPALTEWVAKSADAEPFIINNARLVLQQADKTDQHEMTK